MGRIGKVTNSTSSVTTCKELRVSMRWCSLCGEITTSLWLRAYLVDSNVMYVRGVN